MLRSLFGVLFPDRCVGCRVRGTLMCVVCFSQLKSNHLPLQDFITSVYSYKDPRIKQLVHLLKYQNTRHAAEVLSLPLAEALMELLGETALLRGAGRVVLVPIPLAPKRYKTRGYNQAELLARATLAHLPKGMATIETKLLQKTVDTLAQARIKNRAERLANLGDCFVVDPGTARKVSPYTTLILIDDVATTGATLIQAKNTLQKAGYTKVYALTIAH